MGLAAQGAVQNTGTPSISALTAVELEWVTSAWAPDSAASKPAPAAALWERVETGLLQTWIGRPVAYPSRATVSASQSARLSPKCRR